MEPHELVDRHFRSRGGFVEVRAVVPRGNPHLAAKIAGDWGELSGEPRGLALGVSRRESQRIEARDHRRVRGDRTTVSERLPSIGERTAASGEGVVDAVAQLDEERAVAEGVDA